MSKHRVAVLKVVSKQLSISAAAAEYGMSRQHLHRLLRRYRDGGLEALEPRSRRPRTNPGRTPDQVRERIIGLRTELMGRGLDAGPVTIAWHLGREGLATPSTSTIRRILHAAGLVTPEPRKRPRSSWIRFEASAPNELWQSDFTHWRLADGTEVEILDWLDDHARFLLAVTARQPAAGTLSELQAQLDAFRLDYNERRPHRATGRITPAEAYRATPKAQAAGIRAAGHFRLRYDLTDRDGRITLRRAGRLHHLKVGAAHARRRVLAIADEREVTVVALDTGEILSTHLIEPDRTYWRNQRRDPGRWPRSPATS